MLKYLNDAGVDAKLHDPIAIHFLQEATPGPPPTPTPASEYGQALAASVISCRSTLSWSRPRSTMSSTSAAAREDLGQHNA